MEIEKNISISAPEQEEQRLLTSDVAIAADEKTLTMDATAADEIVQQAAEAITEKEKVIREKLEELRSDYRVSIQTPYPEEVCTLSVDGIGFFAKGDIHAIKAKQKSGKTQSIICMIAALLRRSWGRLVAGIENPRILLIDTEQKAADTQAVYLKCLKMADMPIEDNYEQLEVYTLRKMSPKERGEAVTMLIENYKPDIVFLDGIVDLSCDFNEVTDSQELIQLMMRLSTENDCAIVNVLHTNKTAEDHNMRGHLGTMLSQKAGNVLECIKSDGDYITVRSADSRHQPVPEWSFTFGEDGLLHTADDQVEIEAIQKAANKELKKAYERQQTEDSRLKVCKQIFAENGEWVSAELFKKSYALKQSVHPTTARTHYKLLVEKGRLVEEKGLVRLQGAHERREQEYLEQSLF